MIVLCLNTQPWSFDFPTNINDLGDPNQDISQQELLDMFSNNQNQTIPTMQQQDLSGSTSSLSDPQSNLSQQQLLARFSDRGAGSVQEASQQEVQRAISAETSTQAQIARTAQTVLPSSAQTLIRNGQTTQATFVNWFNCFFKRGLTWRKKQHTCSNGLELVGCVNCNPYQGDTQCYQLRPILCIYKAQDTRPDYTVNNPFYEGWSGGHIKITKPMRGCYIFSKAHADFICRTEFGFGWRMASHHDGHYIWGMNGMQYAYGSWNWGSSNEGGWNFYAYGNVSTSPYNSYWTYIRNQPGNCWN